MGLNETLDRLTKERELREQIESLPDMIEQNRTTAKISNLAERIFFQRMLKDINPGMSEPKIDAMIDRSVMIATKLYNKLYK